MDKQQLLDSLEKAGFSKEIVTAFSKVPRQEFISREAREMAYNDTALPIGHSQTISQPYTIATMLSLLELKKGQRVLEIGSGSGYVLALLSEMVGEKGQIFGLEVIEGLYEKSKENLIDEDYKNIEVFNKNGSNGFPKKAPFDRILISAALRDIPETIMDQLNEKGGILVAPKGSRFEQDIISIQRNSKTEFEIKKKIHGFLFVPFVD